jgi:hypothetical protein
MIELIKTIPNCDIFHNGFKMSGNIFAIYDFCHCYGLDILTDLCIVFESANTFTLLEPSEHIKREINKILNNVCDIRKSNRLFISCTHNSYIYDTFIVPDNCVIYVFKIGGINESYINPSYLIGENKCSNLCKTFENYILNYTIGKFIYCPFRSLHANEKLSLCQLCDNVAIVGLILRTHVSTKNKYTLLANGIVLTPSKKQNICTPTCQIYYNLIKGHKIDNYSDLFELSKTSKIEELDILPHTTILLVHNNSTADSRTLLSPVHWPESLDTIL